MREAASNRKWKRAEEPHLNLPADSMYTSVCIHVQLVTHIHPNTQGGRQRTMRGERGREGRKEGLREGERGREQSLQCFLVNLFFFPLWNSLALDKDNKYTGTVHG